MAQREAAGSGARRRRNWLGWGLALFILAGCALFLDLDQVLDILSRTHPTALLGLLLLITVDRLMMAWKWAVLLRVVGVRLPLGVITRFYYQGTLTGIFLPSSIGGDLLRATWVAQASGIKHGVFASLGMEKLIGLTSALAWSLVCAGLLASEFHPQLIWLWLPLVALALLALGAGFVLSLHPAVHRFVLGALGRFKTSRLIGVVHQLYEAYSHFSEARRALALNLLLTLAEHWLQMVILVLVARSIGIHTDTLLLFAVTGVQFLVFRIPISPDGWGISELSAIGLYGLIGIDAEAAFAMMFLNHLLTTAACLPGLLFLLQGRPRASATT